LQVFVIDRFTFRHLAKAVGKEKIDSHNGFLNRVELLSALTSMERLKIAEALIEVEVAAGAVICRQGDTGDAMYIVKSGSVNCSKVTKDADGTDRTEELPDIGVGDYFGERALLSGEPRAATISAASDCVLLQLDATAFAILLGPLEQIMTERVAGYEHPISAAEEVQENPQDYKWEDLQVLGTLGQGSFGHVQLVKHTPSNLNFALKGVSKQQIFDTHQQGHIMSEKRVMATLMHPFIIRLHTTFKDANQLYFLLEPVLGGELFSVLKKRKLFKENAARFYAGSVVLAFEYLHSKDTVYRDLKPENLLLDSSGYIKVADFGFAKKIVNKTWTLCGTPEYLSPEIVSGEGHGKGVDWWTVCTDTYIRTHTQTHTHSYSHTRARA
jgi:cGMP-dependent protein kinase